MNRAEPASEPVTRPRHAARATYDRLSRWYDRLTGAEQRCNRAVLARLAPQPGERLLEIGSGTGQGLLAARALQPGLIGIGVDLSPGMCAVARRRLTSAGVAPRLVLGDGVALPFAAGGFDVVFLGFTLELFDAPDMVRVLADCRRVLRPAGRLGVAALSLARGRPWPVRLYEAAHRRWPRLVDCRPIYAARAVEAAGFLQVTTEQFSLWGLPVTGLVAINHPGT